MEERKCLNTTGKKGCTATPVQPEREQCSGVVSTLAKNQAQTAGLGNSTNTVKYRNQDFEALRSKCLSRGEQFCDPIFPAAPESLGYKELGPNSPKTRGVQWKRPSELCSDPKFIISGATRTDICQGALGDCWLMAAIASLTLDQKILARVIHPEQSFAKDYAGIFHFQLWQYGQWVDVVIDDKLPTRDGRLLFVHSADRNEFWSALLEKAYAKVNGSYEALSGGWASEGFEDFTGGVAESYELSKAPSNLFNIIKQALSRGSLLCTTIYGSRNEMEAVTKEKLVKTHVYSVTGAVEVNVGGSKVQLVRLRNPWGQTEWNGAWSDNSKEWDQVLPQEKAKLNYSAEDGEFWMAYSDFKVRYSKLEICNLTPDASNSNRVSKWALQQFEGSWKVGSTAGGCINNTDTFWINPQYKITLLEEDDDPVDNEKACSFLVALMQKDRRRYRKQGQELYAIGFSIYKVPVELRGSPSVRLQKDFFLRHSSCARSEAFAHYREVSARLRLPPGDYLIVPSTFKPSKEADFVLRVFTEKQSKTQELGNDVSFTLSEESDITERDIDPSFKTLFASLSGEDKEISAEELRGFLNTHIVPRLGDLKTDGFSLEACKSIVELLDTDGSERLGLVEFQILWNKLKKWMESFCKFDLDKSGTMNSYEIRLALESAGYELNNKLNQLLVARYADKGVIDFDNFISCLVKLETVLRAFKKLDKDGTGFAKLNISEVIYLLMHLHKTA
ncbi:calpain-1 catalytic subunit-like [Colossoma macropomum]|uniref:calpain-1 catalytic subunit-like n=1 Tax=Colossoma macropomum TaxID=42526 RepID=UPI0018642D07|nr:calpain-1 catalytic subunit-like [Colossoma macropomum]